MPPNESSERSTPTALTGRQKMALMLERAGYSHAAIAARLGTTRQAVSQLLARGHDSEKELRRTVEEFISAA